MEVVWTLLLQPKRLSTRLYKKFKTQGVHYTMEIPTPKLKSTRAAEPWLNDLITGIIHYLLSDSEIEIRAGERIGLTLNNIALGTDPIYISPRRPDQLSADVVLNQIMAVFDSNKDFFLNGFLIISSYP